MSQYLPDRRHPQFHDCPPPPASSSPISMTLPSPPTQQWPQYYTNSGQLPPSQIEAYATYPQQGHTASSSSLYEAAWQSNAVASPDPDVRQTDDAYSNAESSQGHRESVPHASFLVPDYRSQQQSIISLSATEMAETTPHLFDYRSNGARSSLSQSSGVNEGVMEDSGGQSPGWDVGVASGNIPYGSRSVEYGSVQLSQEVPADRQAFSSGPASRARSIPSTLSTPPDSPASSTPVKTEPDDGDGRFIMELSFPQHQAGQSSSSRSSPSSPGVSAHRGLLGSQSLVPPTEVPLRATQASKEMRSMMGVFRLNPFAMHSLSLGGDGESKDGSEGLGSPIAGAASWCGGEAKPLEEEPVVLEFQLDLVGLEGDEEEQRSLSTSRSDMSSEVPMLGAQEESQLRPFSPSFELHEDDLAEAPHSHIQPRFEVSYQEHGRYEDEGEVDRQSESWEDADHSGRSENDGSSTTTQSVHTPLLDGTTVHGIPLQEQKSGGYEQRQSYHHASLPPPTPSSWQRANMAEQYQVRGTGEFSKPTSATITFGGPKVVFSNPESPHRGPRLHTTTSHPYLRKSLQNYQSTTHPGQHYSRVYAHPESQAGYSLLSSPTHHTQNVQQPPLDPRHAAMHNEHYVAHQHPLSQSSNLETPQQVYPGRSQAPEPFPTAVSTIVPSDFPQLPSSYMRSGPTYNDQETEQDGYSPSPGTNSPINEVHSGPFASASAMTTALVIAHPLMHGHHHVVPPEGPPIGPAANNRRWSLPETGIRLGQGSFLGNV